jgi:hypothetical protein
MLWRDVENVLSVERLIDTNCDPFVRDSDDLAWSPDTGTEIGSQYRYVGRDSRTDLRVRHM